MRMNITDMSYAECGSLILQLKEESKRNWNCNEVTLADMCECSTSTFARRRREKTLPYMGIWLVIKLAKFAGYEIFMQRREK